VATVTEGRVLGVLAVAHPDFLFFSEREFHGAKTSAFVITITHGLVTAESASTPPVITSFEFKGDGFFIVNFWEGFHEV
jgi:hypothetical protein